MKTRRGAASFWPGEMGKMILTFYPGALVRSTIWEDSAYSGIVKDVDQKTNKITVAWNGGAVMQHDPDEIALLVFQNTKMEKQMKKVEKKDANPETKIARRLRKANLDTLPELSAIDAEIVSGSPAGVTDFVKRFLQLYSQFYLYHWQTEKRSQHIAFEEANDDLAEMMDEFVEAYQGKYGRVSIGGTCACELVDTELGDEIAFTESYRDFLSDYSAQLAEVDGDLKGIVDNMIARVNKLLYLLTLHG